MNIDRRRLSLGLVGAGMAASLPAVAKTNPAARPWPYLIGADVSWIPEDEGNGAAYFENGVQKDPLAILKGAGLNAIKLRLFVNPENGYSRRQPDKKWCGIEQTVKFARRIKAAGFHLSLTFHMSDNWADPRHQPKPVAWETLPVSGLVDAVHKHVTDSLSAMKAAECAPDLVIVGNETTFGFVWPDGAVVLPPLAGNNNLDDAHTIVPNAGGFDNFAAMLKAGIAGSREVLPAAKVAIHNHIGRDMGTVKLWTDNLLQRGVKPDAVGLSCYQEMAHGDWENTFAQFPKAYPELGVFMAEYSSRKRYCNDIVHAQPHGWGAWIWEPTRHQEAVFTRDGINAGGGPRPDLLEQGTTMPGAPALPRGRGNGGRYDADEGLLDQYRQMAKDYGLRKS